MKSRAVRLCLVLAAASLLLGGCSVFDEIGSWFATNGKKSNLRGVRIPVMSLDSELKADATAGRDAGAAAAALSQSRMAAARRLCLQRHVSSGRAGTAAQDLGARMPARATISTSHLTSAPVVGGGLIYALDSEAHICVFRAGDGHPVWNRRLAPKNGTDLPTLWGLLGKPNTVDPPQGHGRRRRL